MANPMETRWFIAMRILRYLNGTTDLNIFYKKGENTTLVAYTNNDFAREIYDWKSMSGFVFSLGSGAISWSFKKQPAITLFTT